MIEHAGAQLLYLPPYDFHPIEACRAKIKQGRRAPKPALSTGWRRPS